MKLSSADYAADMTLHASAFHHSDDFTYGMQVHFFNQKLESQMQSQHRLFIKSLFTCLLRSISSILPLRKT